MRRGRTSVLPYFSQIEAVHLALLPVGKVLYYSGFREALGEHTETRLWNPKTGQIRLVDTPADIFCAGHSITPSGALLSTGGTLDYGDLPPPAVNWFAQRVLEPLLSVRIQDIIFKAQGIQPPQGISALYLFDPRREEWSYAGDMRHGRWYPTTCALPDGGIMILSGRHEHRGKDGWRYEESAKRRVRDDEPEPMPHELMMPHNMDVEVFYEGSGLKHMGQIRGPGVRPMDPEAMKYGGHHHMFPTEYPRLHVLPLTHMAEGEADFHASGRVFCSGYGPETKMLNLGSWEWTHVDDLRAEHPRHDGNCVLLPLDYRDDYRARVLTYGGSREGALRAEAMHSSEIIDFSSPDPRWTLQPSVEGVQSARVHGAAVQLPDGNVMAVGGNSTGMWTDPVMEVNVFDPTDDTWSSDHVPLLVGRGYHATAVLLPDARVLVTGTTPAAYGQLAMEVYSPYYLFTDDAEGEDGWGRPVARPRITAVGGSPAHHGGPAVAAGYGSAVKVAYVRGERPLRRAALMRPGAMTHAFDMDQRHVWVHLEDSHGEVAELTMPPDAHVAPPGHYMIFLLDEGGTPSEAAWIRLGA